MSDTYNSTEFCGRTVTIKNVGGGDNNCKSQDDADDVEIGSDL